MRRLCLSLWTSSLVLSFISASPAAALSREVPLDEVFTQGEAVFVGKVVSTRAVWGEGKKMIWTEYTFDVRETWKGEGVTRRVVRVAGGKLDGKAIQLSHVPSFETGGTYVVSAYGNDHRYASPVVGTEQGSFREVIEEASGETLLVDTEGRRLERDGSGRLRRGRPSEPACPSRHRPPRLRPRDGAARLGSRSEEAAGTGLPRRRRERRFEGPRAGGEAAECDAGPPRRGDGDGDLSEGTRREPPEEGGEVRS